MLVTVLVVKEPGYQVTVLERHILAADRAHPVHTRFWHWKAVRAPIYDAKLVAYFHMAVDHAEQILAGQKRA